MKNTSIFLSLLVVISCASPKEQTEEDKGKLTPQLFHLVKLEDDFWQPRLTTQAKILVPFALDKTQPAVENLRRAGQILDGDSSELPFAHRFVSSDLYKVMEGAALLLAQNRNPLLERRLDSIITIIGNAQREDGYLYVAHIAGVSKNHDQWGGAGMGDRPYSFVLHSHELYNMGHMYEAAIAYYLATGKDKWLKIAEKNAQHINKVFFEGDSNYNDGKPVNQAPGHQEIELALVKLFQVTGNDLYLNMAKKFLDIRGVTYHPDGEGWMSATYSQQHQPVIHQREPVGHAVRAAYMYAGMADVAAMTKTTEYDSALQSIWSNIIDGKMHITGGLGAKHGIEGFGDKYELPNKEAYNETCAAVGNVLLNHRLFLMTKDPKYMDVAEISLYNNVLAGVNFEGNKFFYVNPLESDGHTEFNHGKPGRSPWFGTACCPSNLARLIPQVSGMIYAYLRDEIFVTLYIGSSTTIQLKDGNVAITQSTNYPFDGKVDFQINPSKQQQFSLYLRIPTWTQDQILPGNLYAYTAPNTEQLTVKVNGESIQPILENGFMIIERTWNTGDRVILELPMAVNFNESHEMVKSNEGKLAISRGPLVYCAEEIDNETVAQNLIISSDITTIETIEYGPLKGIKQVQIGKDQNAIKLVPYYTWNNRGNASMAVWLTNEKTTSY